MFFSYVVLKWKDNRWLYKAPCCFMWVSWDTSSQTDWPAGSSSHPCYLTIIRQEGGSVWESPRSVHPQVFCICRKPDVFNAPVFFFFFFKKENDLMWFEFDFLFLFLNTHFLLFQKLRRKRRVTGWGQQDFPSMLSSLKVIKALSELPQTFITKKGNVVWLKDRDWWSSTPIKELCDKLKMAFMF